MADLDGDAVVHEYLLAHKVDCRLCAFVVGGGVGSQLPIEFLEPGLNGEVLHGG